MSALVYGLYTTDDGAITCALQMLPDTFSVMGFEPAPFGTDLRPQGLLTRKEVFYNSVGSHVWLPFPTTMRPYEPGLFVTIRGDPTFMATEIIAEINQGESS